MNWRTDLKNSYFQLDDLLHALKLNVEEVNAFTLLNNEFPFRVTKDYASRMIPKDPKDPLLLQVLPVRSELEKVQDFDRDPVGELHQARHSSLLQKYSGRALLITTGACAINCRYCFRRVFPYGDVVGPNAMNKAIKIISNDKSLKEIILSGGDPLILDDEKLADIFDLLDPITHVKRIRIHSRLPIVLPSRITQSFIELMRDKRFETCLVVHVNHPNELDQRTTDALRRCKTNGLTVLNQAVLLKNVNDKLETLVRLSETLFSAGVLPYYMHLLDRVAGASHFEVTAQKSLELETQLRKCLPGYLMPAFVREVSGMASKTPIQYL